MLLTDIWLRRSARGAGLGGTVLADVVAQAAATGARTVRAETTAQNASAVAVLRRLGFLVAEPDASGRVVATSVLTTETPPGR